MRRVPARNMDSTAGPSRFPSHDHLHLLTVESSLLHLLAMKRIRIQEGNQPTLDLQRKTGKKMHRTDERSYQQKPQAIIGVVVLQTAAVKRPKCVIGDIPVLNQQIAGLDLLHPPYQGTEKIKDLHLTTEKSDLSLAHVLEGDRVHLVIVVLVRDPDLVVVLVTRDHVLDRTRREVAGGIRIARIHGMYSHIFF